MSSDDDDSSTNHHESIDDLRRDLMQVSTTWQAQADRRQHIMDDPESASDDQKIAVVASLMAASYSYALAAVLGIAQSQCPREVAQHLAFEVDEILADGDFDDYNADVTVNSEAPHVLRNPDFG